MTGTVLPEGTRCGIHGRPTRYGRCSTCTPWVLDDGGRSDAGFTGEAGDCVTRAIAIATQLPYLDVYRELHERERLRAARARTRAKRSPREGVWPEVYRPYLEETLGWRWTPTMSIGSGCRVHLRAEELPAGRIIVRTSRHLAAVIDGVLRDTHDASRDGTRCVYGYWSEPET